MFDYSSRLALLGYRPLRGEDDATNVDAKSLLEHVGFDVPEDYREFLCAFPRAGVFDKRTVFSGIQASPWASDGSEVLEVLYGYCSNKSNDLIKVRERYRVQLPAHFLAIGQVTGANLICLDMRRVSFGRIYVWDHEHLGGDEEGFYLAAESFIAFIESLRFGDEQPSARGAKLIKMELSDALRARAAEILKNRKG